MTGDLSQFKKIKSTPDMTILRHPSGHEIKIAHRGLGDGLRSQLEKLPHFDEGGGVSQVPNAPDPLQSILQDVKETPPQPQESTAHAVGQYLRNIGSQGIGDAAQAFKSVGAPVAEVAKNLVSGLAGESEETPDQAPQKGEANKSAPTPANYSLPQSQGSPSPQLAGYQSPYEAEAQAAQRQAESAQKLESWTKGHMDAIDKERQNFQKDIAAGHIDPNKFMNEMGSGQKIQTAIGLILGGLGSGLTGGPNMASKFLNDQIDRNIQAQMADLGKNQNLLSSLTHQFGNVKDASEMFRVLQNDHYVAEMQKAATQIQDPLKRQQMLAAMQQYQQQGNASAQGVAMRQGAQSASRQGGMDPTIMIRAMIPDPKEQEPYFKELQTSENMNKQRDNLMQTFDELTHVNTIAHTAAHPIDTMAANERAIASLAALAKESEGRVTEADVAFLHGLLPKRGVSAEENGKRRMAMMNYVSQKMSFPRLDSIGANPSANQTRLQAKPNSNVAPAPLQVNYRSGQ